jgi:hypothetical protein
LQPQRPENSRSKDLDIEEGTESRFEWPCFDQNSKEGQKRALALKLRYWTLPRRDWKKREEKRTLKEIEIVWICYRNSKSLLLPKSFEFSDGYAELKNDASALIWVVIRDREVRSEKFFRFLSGSLLDSCVIGFLKSNQCIK